VLGDVVVLRDEQLRVFLDALGEPTDRLGPALDVGLHRLDHAGGLVRDQLTVVAHLVQHGLGEVPVALVHVGERLGDVQLDLLELRPDDVDPMQRGGAGDVADRGRRGLHRLTRPAFGLRQVAQVVLQPRGAHGRVWNRSSDDVMSERIAGRGTGAS
jgi:hypothetical protein